MVAVATLKRIVSNHVDGCTDDLVRARFACRGRADMSQPCGASGDTYAEMLARYESAMDQAVAAKSLLEELLQKGGR